MAKFVTKPHRLTITEFQQGLIERPNDPDIVAEKEKLAKYLTETLLPHRESFIQAIEAIKLSKTSFALAVDTINSHRASMASFLDMVQTSSRQLQSTISLIQSFKLPEYLSLDINQTVERFSQLYEPVKMIGRFYAMQETPTLFYRLPELHAAKYLSGEIPQEIKYKNSLEVEEAFVKETVLFEKETERLEEEALTISPDVNFHFDPLRATFIVWQRSIVAINFLASEPEKNVFQCFYHFLQERGKIKGTFWETFVTFPELVGMLAKPSRWIINMRGNIMKRIEKSGARDVISISEYDKSIDGYWFRVSRDFDIPKLSAGN